MTVVFESGLFSVLLTLCAYELGLWLQKKWHSPICNPVLIAVVSVMAFLWATKLPNSTYQAGCSTFSWLLTPATVCLAVPLYEQLQALRKNIWAILVGVAAGTVVSLVCVALLCAAFGMDRALTVSLLPKSITTAMGIAMSEQLGGIPAISTVAIVITGILGSVMGEGLCKVFRIQDPVAQGVAFGTASHIIGTTKASELSQLTGAVSSLSLVIAGILTAVLCPIFVSFL